MDHIVEKLADIAVFRLARPNRLNALTLEGFRAAAEAFDTLAKDEDVRAVVISGKGATFCAGASLEIISEELGTSPEGGIAPDRMRVLFDTAVNAMMLSLWNMPKPIVCAVNGAASGGGVGLALAGDVVLAARSAYFHLPFVPKLGIVPDCGSSWLVSRLAGRGRALPAMLMGDRISAETALGWGLVWDVVDDDAILEQALKTAGKLAAGPVQIARDLRHAVDAAAGQGLDEQLNLERDVNARLCAARDFAEGIGAFLEKRTPDFRAGSAGGGSR